MNSVRYETIKRWGPRRVSEAGAVVGGTLRNAKSKLCRLSLYRAAESRPLRVPLTGDSAGTLKNWWHLFAICFLLFAFSFTSCNRKSPDQAKQDSRYKVYKGEVNVDVDQSLEPIMKLQKEVFDYHYDSVSTNFWYKTEKEMFEDFKSKKATLLILSRMLEKSEIDNLRYTDTIFVRELPIAYDAVALIASPGFDDSKLSLELLKNYFDPKSSNGSNPKLVFENQNSSTVRFVLDKLGYKEKVSSNVFAMKSATEVVDYVAQNKNVIGFVPYNLISDVTEERVKKMLEKIKILSLRAKSPEGDSMLTVSANQSDIAASVYPLIRTLNTVTRFSYEDNLDLLVVSFLSKQKGAKIFLKAGLMPAQQPQREINVKEERVKSGE